MVIAVVWITPSARPLAESLARELDAEAVQAGSDTGHTLRALFTAGRPIVALCASGILIRSLSTLLADKHAEPHVVAVAEDGSAAVPLLGGHHGANTLARRIAEITGGVAAVTTASDLRLGVALDDPPPGYVLANPEHAKPFAARLLAGEPIRIEGSAPWLDTLTQSETAALTITMTTHPTEGAPDHLVYHPRTFALGVGCERGIEPAELITLVRETLAAHHLSPKAIAGVFSLDLKSDEPAVHALATDLAVPARFFTAARLAEESPRLVNPSDIVLRETGCPGVAEGAALAAAGPQSRLVVEKTRGTRATCALAQSPAPLVDLPGRPRGKLSVVGIGPGSREWLSPAAATALTAATDWVGYGLYLDLVAHLSAGKTEHRFPLGAEEIRVRKALALAAEGRTVALVSSGDAGIYAMGSLACELLDRGDLDAAAARAALDIIPGISAFQAAAARAGALIGHDFCCISLSDLLTPWAAIEQRLEAAASSDLVTALYNPRSARRTDQLARAIAILGAHRPPDTPVIVASNLGRPDERFRVVPFSTFDPATVDMLTIVLVGSSDSRAFTRGDGSTIAYTPRGYAGKHAGKHS
ncbi:MAG TPA: precorrin-3B C(17)-methyltransferase [Aestuariivirgaceae bacterium]|nr:precorrin-3B C(17)-methyltransferase [Aestuariivirgaceae bacterium]